MFGKRRVLAIRSGEPTSRLRPGELPRVWHWGRTPRAMASALESLGMGVLRGLPPELAQHLALFALRSGLVTGSESRPDDPILRQRVLGLDFSNPIGLAAGADKDAVAVRAFMRLGFGLVEAGTVTPRPQPGNPRPRLFRLAEDRAAINRMGFNGGGLKAFVRRISRLVRHSVPLGVNVGLNKDGADPERDYPALIAAVAPYADYVAINVSSPNTPGLRDLQAGKKLESILRAIAEAVPTRPPLLVKIAPDLSERGLEEVIAASVRGGAAGLIVGNTTTERPPGLRSRHASEAGGLSGAPLFAKSTQMLGRAYALAAGGLVLIGCGGVFSGRDALAKIRAGAHLVQLYTALAYEGPPLIPRLKSELAAALRTEGFGRLSEAVGVDARRLAGSPCSS